MNGNSAIIGIALKFTGSWHSCSLCSDVFFRQQLSEAKSYRETVRMKKVVPYFHPENISLYQVKYILIRTLSLGLMWVGKDTAFVSCFQNLLHDQTHDTPSLSMDLPALPKSESHKALIIDTPEKNSKLSQFQNLPSAKKIKKNCLHINSEAELKWIKREKKIEFCVCVLLLQLHDH